MSTLEISQMSRAVAAGITAVGLTLFLACGGSYEEPDDVAVEESAPAEEVAPIEEAAPAPEAAPGPETTAPAAVDVARGKATYEMYCAACHGTSGKGDGPAAATLPTKPADHSDGNIMNAISNDDLLKTIKEGGAAIGKSSLMPAWGATLNDDQIRDVIAFVRSLADPPYQDD